MFRDARGLSGNFYRRSNAKNELIVFSGIRLVRKRRRSIPEIGATVKKAKTGHEVALKRTRSHGYHEADGVGLPGSSNGELASMFKEALRH